MRPSKTQPAPTVYAAGWGIGHGIALALADAGANLVIRCSRARLTALFLVPLAVLVKPVAAAGQPPHDASESYNYRVVASYPHDPSAFTQGLLIAGIGFLRAPVATASPPCASCTSTAAGHCVNTACRPTASAKGWLWPAIASTS